MKVLLEEAIELLQAASAVIVDDNAVVYPSVWTEGMGEDDNEFLYLEWDQGTHEYNAKFSEGPNREITVIGSSMFLIDTEGDERQITLLKPWDIDPVPNKHDRP